MIRMKYLLILSSFLFSMQLNAQDFEQFDEIINAWHQAATDANFEEYFSRTSEDFVFLGTDPKERWTKKEFEAFCKPYFDKGKAWDFKVKSRNWEGSLDDGIVWFDELLDTHMNDCRGSGILKNVNGEWMLVYYNLTVLIENEKMQEFRQLRAK